MSADLILAVNGGSSSLKCGLFSRDDPDRSIQEFNLPNPGGEQDGLVDCLNDVLQQVGRHDGVLSAIGHRVVHGGDLFDGPVVVSDKVMAALERLTPLAPLHQPANLALIRACQESCAGIPQVACFDTAFHRSMPALARNYALPYEMTEAGLHAYGFHGLSYEYIWERLTDLDADAMSRRIVVAHLGAGASLCAIRDGKSIATTMGFSTAEGLPMMSRTGSIDPGIIIHLIRESGMSADDLERLIYRDSGLQGISGIKGGMREQLASDNPRARAAVEFFVYRIVREIGSLTAALGGLDLLVFTGGIGENEESIRRQVANRLTWLDDEPEVRVIPTDEEAMIATHTVRLLANERRGF